MGRGKHHACLACTDELTKETTPRIMTMYWLSQACVIAALYCTCALASGASYPASNARVDSSGADCYKMKWTGCCFPPRKFWIPEEFWQHVIEYLFSTLVGVLLFTVLVITLYWHLRDDACSIGKCSNRSKEYDLEQSELQHKNSAAGSILSDTKNPERKHGHHNVAFINDDDMRVAEENPNI